MLFFKNDALRPQYPGASVHPADHVKATDEEKWYVCNQCHQKITQPGFHLNVQGRHEHTYANPSGIVYNIKCFSNAQGYSFLGPASTEFTWFSGHSWRIIICAACLTHIGWYFKSNGGAIFFGFISDRLLLISTSSE